MIKCKFNFASFLLPPIFCAFDLLLENVYVVEGCTSVYVSDSTSVL